MCFVGQLLILPQESKVLGGQPKLYEPCKRKHNRPENFNEDFVPLPKCTSLIILARSSGVSKQIYK